MSFTSISSHRVSQCDENRVKIQVPSATSCSSWNQATGSCGPASIASIDSSSSSTSSSTSSRGVVTVLEGPQSCTTVVESLSNEPVKVCAISINDITLLHLLFILFFKSAQLHTRTLFFSLKLFNNFQILL